MDKINTVENKPKIKVSSNWKHFISGGCGGVSLVFAGHPLDTIKVRLQTQPTPAPGKSPLYNGLLDCARKTIRHEGIRGLYKGMGTPLLVATPMCAVGFWGYGLGKSLQTADKTGKLSNFQILKAGMLSGLLIAFLNAPGERIKCLLQIQRSADPSKARYSGPLDCARQIYKESGLSRGLYRGFSFTIFRDVPASGAYFVTYELLLKNLASRSSDNNQLTPLKIIIAGGSAGVLANLVGLPSDVLKSRFQTSNDGINRGLIQFIRITLKQDGPGAFFKGATPMMARAFPANAACFLGFEASKKLLDFIF